MTLQLYTTLCNITQPRPASLIALRKILLQLPTQIRLQSYPKRVCGYSKGFLTTPLQAMRNCFLSVVATMNLARLLTICILYTTSILQFGWCCLPLHLNEYMELPSLFLLTPKRLPHFFDQVLFFFRYTFWCGNYSRVAIISLERQETSMMVG